MDKVPRSRLIHLTKEIFCITLTELWTDLRITPIIQKMLSKLPEIVMAQFSCSLFTSTPLTSLDFSFSSAMLSYLTEERCSQDFNGGRFQAFPLCLLELRPCFILFTCDLCKPLHSIFLCALFLVPLRAHVPNFMAKYFIVSILFSSPTLDA